jgi:hypothetical protein
VGRAEVEPRLGALDPDLGSVGSTVTLYGTGFAAADAIYFAGRHVRPEEVTSKRIRFRIPDGAYTDLVGLLRGGQLVALGPLVLTVEP